ncbi:hypothetical protein BDP27DRAFT_1403527 [Rhodocollybia butyracea]|uniref:Uncharacterized protein n=1 Tax=Rhodocollybia butyracea TaxID=206335 RepID=A0A9P5PSW4_9AGAR|nr:hypothetical protein BDP27DRAFT_1403527 [Rhodocollybia butyracea]
MSLSEAEVEGVRQTLAETTDFRVFPLLVETILWAIFTVLIFTMSYIVISRGLRARSKQIMLAFTLVMYTLATLDWAIDVRRVWTDLKVSIPEELSSPQDNDSALNTENMLLRVIQAITNNICVVMGDLIVCWRVCVVCRWRKSVTATAIVLLLIQAATALTCNLTQIGISFPNLIHLHALAPSQLYIDIIALSSSALINIWATGMIAHQVWYFRHEIQQQFANGSDRRTFTECVLIIFVETGTVYTVLWILKNVIVIPQISPTPYVNYANFTMNIIVGMYPTLILILVALRRSHLEHEFGRSDNNANTGPLRFAPAISSQQLSNISIGGNMVFSIPAGQRLTTTETPYESSSKSGSSETLKNKNEAYSEEGIGWC